MTHEIDYKQIALDVKEKARKKVVKRSLHELNRGRHRLGCQNQALPLLSNKSDHIHEARSF